MADGNVIEATAKDTGYGLRITTLTEYEPGKAFDLTYGHFQRILFGNMPWRGHDHVYATVKRGQVIGYVDSTGFSTGNHLHVTLRFFLRINGVWTLQNTNNGYGGAVDVLPYISAYSMARIFKQKSGPTIYIAFPVDKPENLTWLAKQVGRIIPEKGDGTIDWNNVTYDGLVE